MCVRVCVCVLCISVDLVPKLIIRLQDLALLTTAVPSRIKALSPVPAITDISTVIEQLLQKY